MQKILILTDFTSKSEHAARFAAQIAERTHSDLLLFNAFPIPQVIPTMEPLYPSYEDLGATQKEESEKLQLLAARLQKLMADKPNGSPAGITYLSEPGSLGENIGDVLRRKKNIWLIVMGDKKKDDILSRFIFGSDTFRVISTANCPVLLVPEKSRTSSIETIVFASNLTKTDYKALRKLAHFAAFFKAKILVTHVYPHRLTLQEKVEQYETYIKIIKKVEYPHISYQDFKTDGDGIADGLMQFVRKSRPSILAMVNRKHPFFERMLHHSATQDIQDYHRVPILILPAAE